MVVFLKPYFPNCKPTLSPNCERPPHGTYTELRKTIPSFVRRAHWQHRHFKSYRDFSFKTTKLASELAAMYLTEMPVQNAETVRLIDYDPDAEAKLLAAMLYPHASQSLSQIRRVVDRLSPTEKEKIIQEQRGLAGKSPA